jgi:Na+/melibiose symporter-like transporter
MKPGLQRAIPATILAFFLAAALVSLIQRLQMGDAYVYNSSVTLVLAPFFMVFAFIWGMGGLDPRMSEHAHAPQESDGVAIVPVAESHDDHPDPYEEAAKKHPFRILTGQIWTVATVVLLVFFGILAFAQVASTLRLDTTSDPMASASMNAQNATFDLPVGLGTFQADKLSVFLGFIAFTMLSLLVVAGLLGLMFYSLNQGVTTVRAIPTTESPAPIRRVGPLVGRAAGALARGLKRGLPAFFGQK